MGPNSVEGEAGGRISARSWPRCAPGRCALFLFELPARRSEEWSFWSNERAATAAQDFYHLAQGACVERTRVVGNASRCRAQGKEPDVFAMGTGIAPCAPRCATPSAALTVGQLACLRRTPPTISYSDETETGSRGRELRRLSQSRTARVGRLDGYRPMLLSHVLRVQRTGFCRGFAELMTHTRDRLQEMDSPTSHPDQLLTKPQKKIRPLIFPHSLYGKHEGVFLL